MATLNDSVSLYAQGGPSHILQQNRAALFVWLFYSLLRPPKIWQNMVDFVPLLSFRVDALNLSGFFALGVS